MAGALFWIFRSLTGRTRGGSGGLSGVVFDRCSAHGFLKKRGDQLDGFRRLWLHGQQRQRVTSLRLHHPARAECIVCRPTTQRKEIRERNLHYLPSTYHMTSCQPIILEKRRSYHARTRRVLQRWREGCYRDGAKGLQRWHERRSSHCLGI